MMRDHISFLQLCIQKARIDSPSEWWWFRTLPRCVILLTLLSLVLGTIHVQFQTVPTEASSSEYIIDPENDWPQLGYDAQRTNATSSYVSLEDQVIEVVGQVREDSDADGDLEDTDTGIANVSIELSDGICILGSSCPNTTTDSDGLFVFSNVAPGTYTLVENDPKGYSSTADSDEDNDNQIVIDLISGVSASRNDFLDARLSLIRGSVWEDNNGNNEQDSNEIGIQDVTLDLYIDINADGRIDEGDSLIESFTTEENGTFGLTDLRSGDYLLQVTDINGTLTEYGLTNDSDLLAINLDENQEYIAADFGYQRLTASIGDLIWEDANENSIHENTEPGLENITLTIFSDPDGDGDTADGEVLAITTSDDLGTYGFSDLPEGNYVVIVDEDSIPPQHQLTTSNTPISVQLFTGQNFTDADFGYVNQSVITNTPIVQGASSSTWNSAPEITNIQVSQASVGTYEKFEIQFDVLTGASDLQFPFDPSPPSGISSNIGISIDAHFSPDGWNTVYRQPAFYYQDFDHQVKGSNDWIYPTDQFFWVVRFSPDIEGTWQFKLVAEDANGLTETIPQSFTVTSSDSHGFIRVSDRDPRYFEFDDGTYFPGLGYNMNYRHIDWVNPTLANQNHFEIMGQNGIELIRIWLSQWSIFGAEWNPWKMFVDNSYFPAKGLTFNDAYPGSEVSLKIDADWNKCVVVGWENPKIPLKRNTDYKIQIRFKTENVTGPQIAGNPYGLVAKYGGWLWDDGDPSKQCDAPGTGSPITPYANENTSDWQILEASFNSGDKDFFDLFYIALENVTGGNAYIDHVWIQEDHGDGSLGSNIIQKPDMDHHQYFDQRNSYAFDEVLDLAAQNNVLLRPVLSEKNDWILNRIDFTGNIDTVNPGNDYFYGDYRNTTRTRWLLKVWWRYVQARWGFSTNIHSWELLNEGDPWSDRHYTLADEFGEYMHQFSPNDHLASTSTWHSFPKDQFWANSKYPEIDFADIHQYIPQSDPAFNDAAYASYEVSMQYGANQAEGAGKPIIRGETGFVSEGSGPPSDAIKDDVNGIWLHNYIWSGLNAGGLIESYWYETTHIYDQRPDGSYRFDHRPQFKSFSNFVSGLQLNNGHYEDAAPTVTNNDLRVWGQKDQNVENAHLWIQNRNHTWKNVVDGVASLPVSGMFTLTGFTADRPFIVEWWDTYETNIDAQIISTEQVVSSFTGQIEIPVDDLTMDVAVKIYPAPVQGPPTESASWPMAGANPQRTSWTPEEVRGNLQPQWYRPFEPYIPPKVQIIAAYETLYISTSKGLYALDAETGAEKWVYPTELPLGHSPTIHNGVAYVGGFDHKLHAIDAFTGQGLWTFEAEKGFQTNPLVADGLVIAGNRDGYMYAIHAHGTPQQGMLAWKYKTDGPVLFSAAYHDGVIYFASNDSHAYALDAQNGNLVWKSAKLPGAGFHSWWPVIYRDRVIFAGSHNYRVAKEPFGGQLNNHIEKPDVYPNYQFDPRGTFIGQLGSEAGDWVAGTITLDTSASNNTANGNTTPITEYLEQKPYRRTYFVLEQSSGQEVTYDFDRDGEPEYAPLLWFGTHSGNRYPPVVGGDGVLYQSNNYKSDPWIPGGHITGWKIDSPFISIQNKDWWNAVDEPQAYAVGGNLIYWNRCCDRVGSAIDIAQPGSSYTYFNYNLDSIIPGYNSSYYLPPGPQHPDVYATFGNSNGVYGQHGDTNPPIPYNDKVYMHRGNSIIAFGLDVDKTIELETASISNHFDDLSAPSLDELTTNLEYEISKILDVGHLRPGYLPGGEFAAHLGFACGDDLQDYWHHPADTLITLIRTLPYLSSDIQGQTKIYIQSEFESYPPYEYNHIGWSDGASREQNISPPEFEIAKKSFTPRKTNYRYPHIYEGWGSAPYAFYAMWKYSEIFGNADQLLSTARSRDHLMQSFSNVPADRILLQKPHILNAYISGYIGYLELERLAGLPETSSIRHELDRLIDLRVLNFSMDSILSGGDYCNGLNTSSNFIYLVPELALSLRDNKLLDVERAIEEYERIAPYWFVSNFEAEYGEGVFRNLYDYHALFQAKALILQEPYEELVKYLDVPGVYRGDLFYIENLVAAIEAGTKNDPVPTPTSPGPTPTQTPTPYSTQTATPTLARSATPTPNPTFTPTRFPTQIQSPPATSTPTLASTSTPTISALKGDLNLDGRIDSIDLQLCINVFFGIELDPGFTQRADINGDALVNAVDVQQLVNLILFG